MKKRSEVGYLRKGWALVKETPKSLLNRTIILSNMGIARVKEDTYHTQKVRITVEEI